MRNSHVLPIIVNPEAPITINAQIAEQIKLLIAKGVLQPGDVLPTVTQLAKHLRVNHNTIATVYNHLTESGYLVAQRSKGTFVSSTQAVQDIITHKQFYNLLGQAFNSATIIGLSPSEFCAAAYAQAVMLIQHQLESLKLVFVEGLQYGEELYEIIKTELKCPLLLLSLTDLKIAQPQAIKELLAANLVITREQLVWEVIQITAPQQEVIGVDTQPDVQLLTQILSLPRNALMLLVCQEESGGKLMKQMLQKAGISHINFQVISFKSLQQNQQLWEQVDAVCTSRLVEEYVSQSSPQPAKVMVFNFNVSETNMFVLKARIAAIHESLMY